MFNKFYRFVADNYFKKLTEIPACKKMAAGQPQVLSPLHPGLKRKREDEVEGKSTHSFFPADISIFWGF